MNARDANAKPVVGELVRRSILKALGMLAFLLVLFVAGIVITLAWWFDFGLPLPSGVVHINLLGGLIGVAATLLAPFMMLGVGALFFLGDRLVLGDDRLQVVRLSGDNAKVVAQFPYRNIANMACVNDEGVRFLGIDLERLDDPDTFAQYWDFQRSKNTDGWHYVIHGGYQKSVDDILKMLVDKTRDGTESD